MVKDLKEKQLQVGYFLSRGDKSVNEKFTEFNICKVWLGWWKSNKAWKICYI